MLKPHGKSVVQELFSPLFKNQGVRVMIKRDDLLHKLVSGNKWRKLKYNLEEAKDQNHDTLLTFGGAYSNHIYATAAAAKESGFKSIGIIRGEEHNPLNPTLSFAESQGMALHYVSRTTYRSKHEPWFQEQLTKHYGRFYMVPEGGTNNLAIKGAAELVDEIEEPFDTLCLAVGTGGTIAGVVSGIKSNQQSVLGFSALKGNFLKDEVRTHLENYGADPICKWDINSNFHFGGYGKIKTELVDFVDKFHQEHGVPLDYVYTGKMMFGVCELIKQGYWPEGSTIMVVHTGGLQGNAGFNSEK